MKCPCQIPGQGSFCAHFHEFSLDDGPGFYCNGDIRQMNQAVLCFSTLLGMVVGAAVASRYPLDLQYGGFWLTGFIISVIFYLALPRWHKILKWGTRERASSLSIYHDLAGHECSGIYFIERV